MIVFEHFKTFVPDKNAGFSINVLWMLLTSPFWVEMACQTKVRFPEPLFSFFSIEKHFRAPMLKTHTILFKAPWLYDTFEHFKTFAQTKNGGFLSIFEEWFLRAFFELVWLVTQNRDFLSQFHLCFVFWSNWNLTSNSNIEKTQHTSDAWLAQMKAARAHARESARNSSRVRAFGASFMYKILTISHVRAFGVAKSTRASIRARDLGFGILFKTFVQDSKRC